MERKVGDIIHDPAGNEWLITRVWDHEDYYCMFLTGASGEVLGQMGGYKIEYKDEGGLTANVR